MGVLWLANIENKHLWYQRVCHGALFWMGINPHQTYSNIFTESVSGDYFIRKFLNCHWIAILLIMIADIPVVFWSIGYENKRHCCFGKNFYSVHRDPFWYLCYLMYVSSNSIIGHMYTLCAYFNVSNVMISVVL